MTGEQEKMKKIHYISNAVIRKILAVFIAFSAAVLCGCGAAENKETPALNYRYASKEEGKSLLLGNEEYYNGFSQNDIDYKLEKKDGRMEELLSFAGEQVLDFKNKEKAMLDDYFESMKNTLNEKGYSLPPLEEIVLVKTTMKEESGAGGYTHGTQIYLNGDRLGAAASGDEARKSEMKEILWHELFHCLTRCNPDFRKEMYKLIHFTVVDKDFPIPPNVFEYHISNPDVEHHNSYATFVIDGKNIDCFTDMVTTKHFEKEGDSFFDCFTTALIPIDGTDVYYTPEQAENFDEVFGTNTDYVLDPEECMADNFANAMLYGMDGPEGKGYPNPEIVEGILSYLKAK